MIKKLPSDSLLSYLLLAWVTMSGLAYINFLPALMNALAGGIGFTDAEAGQVIAANGYGALLGNIIAVFLVRRFSQRVMVFAFLLLLATMDILTMWISDFSALIAWRLLAGVLGGLSLGIAFSFFAHLENTDKAFGLLLFIQFGIGSMVIYLMPSLELIWGAYAAFYVMAGFALMSVMFLVFLPDFPSANKTVQGSESSSKPNGHMLLILVAICAYQMATSAIWAYVGLIGQAAGLPVEDVALYIAVTGLLGLLGAMLPVISGNRFGRLNWIVSGTLLSVMAAILMNYSSVLIVYGLSMAVLFFSWPAVQSYLLAIIAETDRSGQLSTVAAFVSYLGLASGPLLASELLGNDDFSILLNVSAGVFLLSLFLLLKPVRAQEDAN